MKSGTLAIILFFAFVITTGVALHANSANGETAACTQNADVLRICTSLKVDSEIARGNEAVSLARDALYAIRGGEDPEVFVPLLAFYLADANLTLAEFGITKDGLARIVSRYYAAEARELHALTAVYGIGAFFQLLLHIYEKEYAMLKVVERDFAPYPIRLLGFNRR